MIRTREIANYSWARRRCDRITVSFFHIATYVPRFHKRQTFELDFLSKLWNTVFYTLNKLRHMAWTNYMQKSKSITPCTAIQALTPRPTQRNFANWTRAGAPFAWCSRWRNLDASTVLTLRVVPDFAKCPSESVRPFRPKVLFKSPSRKYPVTILSVLCRTQVPWRATRRRHSKC